MSKKSYKVVLHYRYSKTLEVEAESEDEALEIAENDDEVIEEYQYYDDNSVEEV